MQLRFKNMFGAAQGGVDQQRTDLFAVLLQFPRILNVGGGSPSANLWEAEVAFAVESFAFPDRSVEMIPVKYLQQTNFMIGADTASGPVNMVVRYAYNRRTGELMERWKWLISNPRTGGVAQTSVVKTTGKFFWLVPNMAQQADIEDTSPNAEVMKFGGAWHLEGCLLQNLKPSDASMTQSTGATFTFGLQCDRYYPLNVTDLNVADPFALVAS